MVIYTVSMWFRNDSKSAFAKRKNRHVVHGPPAETVIDPEDRGLVERSQQNLVQLPCRFEIDTELLLDDDSGTVSVQLRRRAGWRP
jgi:hypothetical protein